MCVEWESEWISERTWIWWRGQAEWGDLNVSTFKFQVLPMWWCWEVGFLTGDWAMWAPPSWARLNTLVRGLGKSSSSFLTFPALSMWKYSMLPCWRMQPWPDTKCLCLVLALSASRTVRNNFLFFVNYQVAGTLLQQHRQRQGCSTNMIVETHFIV